MKKYILTDKQRSFLERVNTTQPWRDIYEFNIRVILQNGEYTNADKLILNNINHDYIILNDLKITDFQYIDGCAVPIYGKKELETELPF